VIHDWNYPFTQLGVIEHDTQIAQFVRVRLDRHDWHLRLDGFAKSSAKGFGTAGEDAQ
jgi:hypothetical protein